MSSNQMRLNQATGEWVIYAPSRQKRPHDLQKTSLIENNSHDSPPSCPFCHGTEETLESKILEFFGANQSQWQNRVISNKYPALTPYENPQRVSHGIYLSTAAYGKQEVIIESPKHWETVATMSVEEVEILIETYHHRYLAMMEDPQILMVILFRNHGSSAGASLRHPHSQIIGTSVVPRNRRWQDQEAQRYFDHWDRCLYCDMLQFEIEQQERIILENSSFVAFVPYAAEVSCEVWIMPKQHQGDFGCINPSQKKDFARILRGILSRLYHKLNNPDYNYVIHSAVRYKSEEPQVHWYCQILPRLSTPAGFEIGSGIPINPSLPEIDAQFLREADI
ncbi:MAG: galactose-1-phosphate uridylyltransferase [Crocosphaera sp.]|nr:galactose-1-phosphate uridylyltransferase [Crocosphaera sp.]